MLLLPGGYPNNPGMFPATPGGLSVKDCATAPGFSEALCFAFRTDNSGPPKNVQVQKSRHFCIMRIFIQGLL